MEISIISFTKLCVTGIAGYGNNAVEMETTAIYDEAKKEFGVYHMTRRLPARRASALMD